MRHDLKLLQALTSAIGPSGYETGIQDLFDVAMAPLATLQYRDNAGNSYAEIKGTGPRIMLSAHADTIGFMVKYIDDAGFIFTEGVGGVAVADPGMLPGTKVSILSRRSGKLVEGQFVPTIPYHLVEDDSDMLTSRHNMAIDIGVFSAEQARRSVSVGDYVVFRPEFNTLGKCISATSLDDRLGTYIMVMAAQHYCKSRRRNKPTLILASTTGEETSLGSAGRSPGVAKPDVVVVLDVMPATDTIRHLDDSDIAKRYGRYRLGSGPVIGRGMAISDDVFRDLERVCIKSGNDYQIELSKLDTDNRYISQGGHGGTKTGMILVPVRNAHTAIETVYMPDVSATIQLCADYILG